MTTAICSTCGDPTTHADTVAACCWCWVVEHGRPPHEPHAGCRIAASRIEKIQTRFRTAIQAERSAICTLIESAKTPIEGMPPQVRAQMRRDPDYVMRVVIDLVVKNLVTLIRTRVNPVPSAKGSAT